jgi:hypothetical protein
MSRTTQDKSQSNPLVVLGMYILNVLMFCWRIFSCSWHVYIKWFNQHYLSSRLCYYLLLYKIIVDYKYQYKKYMYIIIRMYFYTKEQTTQWKKEKGQTTIYKSTNTNKAINHLLSQLIEDNRRPLHCSSSIKEF